MMDDLINKIAFREKIVDMMKAYPISCQVLRELDKFPTVEAKPVVHGEWMHTGYADEYECSNCKIQIALSDDKNAHPNFCPNCGADMRGKKNE